MTTQNETVSGTGDVADPITQDQEQIDAQQANLGGETQPTYVTMQQLETFRNEVFGETRGNQGKLDRIEQAVTGMQQASQSAAIEAQMSNLPDDQPEFKAAMRTLMEENKGMAQQLAQIQQQGPTSTATPVGNEQEREFAQSYGLDPNDSRINYAALAGTGTAMERTQAFMDSVYEIRFANRLGQTAAPRPQQPAQPSTEPPNPGAPTQGPAAGSEEELMDLYITDKITEEDYFKRRKALGAKP